MLSAEAMALGVADLLPWPCDIQQLSLLVTNARDRAATDPRFGTRPTRGLFAQSAAMRELLTDLQAAARGHHHVCLCGELATGRSLVARTLHDLSGRPDDRFVVVDCADEHPHELERRIFGTIAERPETIANGQAAVERVSRESAIYRANGGTLYLPRLTEAPARVQARLARLLRDRELTVDGRSVVPMEARIVVSTEPDIDGLIADGRLVSDLAARVGQVRIDVPSLRRRQEDIPLLVMHFAAEAAAAQEEPPKSFGRSALALLSSLPWSGNAAELASLIGTLHGSVTRRVVQLEDVLEHVSLEGFSARVDTGGTLRDARARFERECISAMLMRHHGRVGDAAKALGIQRTNLYRKVRQLNVSKGLLSSRR
jgi:DNA-binding NtrC family response regulator